MRIIDADALMKAFKAWKTMDDYYHDTDCDDIPFSEAFDLIDNAPTVELLMARGSNGVVIPLTRQQGEWITIEAGQDLLIDHNWYLIVHKDFRTPMKAIYHSDCPHFTFFYEGGEGCSYLFEDKVTHYMELPDIPMKGEEE